MGFGCNHRIIEWRTRQLSEASRQLASHPVFKLRHPVTVANWTGQISEALGAERFPESEDSTHVLVVTNKDTDMNNERIDISAAAGIAAPPPKRTRAREALRYTDTMGVRPIFRITAGFAEALRARPLTDPGLRLGLGLAHLTEYFAGRNLSGCQIAREAMFNQETPLLRRTIGPVASNGTLPFRQGVAALAGTDLFNSIGMTECRREVRWAFAPEVLDRLFDPDDLYGLLDIRAVRDLKGAVPIHLLLATTVAWNMRRPEFTLSLEDLRRISRRDPPASWEDLRRRFLRGLSDVCAQNGTTAMVRLLGVPWTRAIDAVNVKIMHRKSLWRLNSLVESSEKLKDLILLGPKGWQRCQPDEILGSPFEAALCELLKPRAAVA